MRLPVECTAPVSVYLELLLLLLLLLGGIFAGVPRVLYNSGSSGERIRGLHGSRETMAYKSPQLVLVSRPAL